MTKRKSYSYYGKKRTPRGGHSHKVRVGRGRTDEAYDRLYRQQLSLLSRLFHKKG